MISMLDVIDKIDEMNMYEMQISFIIRYFFNSKKKVFDFTLNFRERMKNSFFQF